MAELLGIFGFLVVLVRAAILCLQTIVAGGAIFLTVVARNESLRPEELTRPAWKLIRWCAAGLALSELSFLMINALVLRSSTGISYADVLGANFAIACLVAIAASLAIVFWPESLRNGANAIVLLPAMLAVASSVVTSHS